MSRSRMGPVARWNLAVWLASLVLPLLVLRQVAVLATTALPPPRREVDPWGDPTTNATAMARAWQRWSRGDFRLVDDRVFAPTPNAIAFGEYYPLPALASFPVVELTGSIPLGVNLAYYLALAFFPVCLYALYVELAGPGPAAALAALVVAWGPSRMNSLGVFNTLNTAFAVLAVALGIRWLREGRRRDLLLGAAAVFVQSLSSLYATAMGGLFGAFALPLVVGRAVLSRRFLVLAGAAVVALVPAAFVHAPNFTLRDEIGPFSTHEMFEQHAADLLSLLHGGIFGGPVRDATEALVPGFPPGAAAFFPTLTFLLALGLGAARHKKSDVTAALPSPLPWVGLAAVFFVLALGPTIRLAGRPILPGVYGLVGKLPIFSTMRGIHRYDQWFHVALGAAAVLALRRALAAARRPERLLAAVGAAALLDLWPAPVPANPFPPASPYVSRLRELPRSEIVALYPFDRRGAAQAWVDQLAHGARVANGWFTFAPPVHPWLERTLPHLSAGGVVAAFRELGARVVVVDRGRLAGPQLAEFNALSSGETSGLRRVEDVGDFRLLWLEAVPPSVLDLRSVAALRFEGRQALLPLPGRSLVYRLGPPERSVRVVSLSGSYLDELRTAVAQPPPARLFLGKEPPLGAEILDAQTGRIVGAAIPPPPRGRPE